MDPGVHRQTDNSRCLKVKFRRAMELWVQFHYGRQQSTVKE